MSWRLARDPQVVAGAAAFALAAAMALELARPFRAGPVAFDSAAAVLYFDRIVAGRQLESFVTTLPKPLLTVVYGLLHAVTSDWRPISWAVIIAFALGVGLSTVLAYRLAGPMAAGFMAIGLGTAPQLLLDAGLALAWGWGLLGISLAALALAQPRPRYGLAGVALGLAVLARVELGLLVVGVVAWVVLASLREWRAGRPIPGAPMKLLISTLALPVMLVHDWLLTGNPLHWTGIADRYTAGISEVPDAAEILGRVVVRYADVAVLPFIALLGVVWLYRNGRGWLASGLLLLAPGVTAFLLVLAARGTFVDDRYFAAVDVAMVAAAAFGFAPLRDGVPRLGARLGTIPRTVRAAVPFVAGALAGILLTAAWGAFDPVLRDPVRNQLRVAIDTLEVLPILEAFVDSHPASHTFAPESLDGTPVALVPVRVRTHLVVDLGTPLPEVGSTAGPLIDLRAGYPRPGQIVYHHLYGERYTAGFDVLKTTVPVERDGVRIVPLQVDEDRGYWVVAIEEP